MASTGLHTLERVSPPNQEPRKSCSGLSLTFSFPETRQAHWILYTETIGLSPTWNQHSPSLLHIGTLSPEVTFKYPLRTTRFRLLINSRNTSPNPRSFGSPLLLQLFITPTRSPPKVSLCFLDYHLPLPAQSPGFLPTSLIMTLWSPSV